MLANRMSFDPLFHFIDMMDYIDMRMENTLFMRNTIFDNKYGSKLEYF